MTNWDLSQQYKVGSKFETQYNLLVHFYFSVLCTKTCWDHTKFLFFHTKILRKESKLFLRETVSVQFSCSVMSDSLQPHEQSSDKFIISYSDLRAPLNNQLLAFKNFNILFSLYQRSIFKKEHKEYKRFIIFLVFFSFIFIGWRLLTL